MSKVLWKYDKEDGIIYVCPRCKTYCCGNKLCDNCNEELSYDGEKKEYKGKVNY